MASHSSIIVWRILYTEEFGGLLQSVESWRVRHDWVSLQACTCSLCTHFVENFYHKWMLNFVICFFYIYWDNHMIFILCLVNMVYHIDPCIFGINPIWLRCFILFFLFVFCFILLMYYWILFANILLRIFCIYVYWGYWPAIFFSYNVLVWFWYQDKGGLIKWVWKFPSSSICLKEYEKDQVNSSLNVW